MWIFEVNIRSGIWEVCFLRFTFNIPGQIYMHFSASYYKSSLFYDCFERRNNYDKFEIYKHSGRGTYASKTFKAIF